jgi:hypothetical protein
VVPVERNLEQPIVLQPNQSEGSSIRKRSKKAMPVERKKDALAFKRVKKGGREGGKGTFQLAFREDYSVVGRKCAALGFPH